MPLSADRSSSEGNRHANDRRRTLAVANGESIDDRADSIAAAERVGAIIAEAMSLAPGASDP